jgi:hypothetical protein
MSCTCGDPTRPNINHRKTIPCWTYLGHDRMSIDRKGQPYDPILGPDVMRWTQAVPSATPQRPCELTEGCIGDRDHLTDECVIPQKREG